MFEDLRQVTITGGLTKDPEFKATNAGTPVLKLNVGSTERRKNGDDYENKSHYYEVTVWGRYAEMLSNKLSKGDKVLIKGNLDFQQWIQDGQNRSKLAITATGVKPLSQSTNNNSSNPSPGYSQQQNQENNSYQSKPSQQSYQGLDDDGIPF